MGRRRMLAPWCARESAEQPVLDLGRDAADWCDAATPGQVTRTGRGRAAPGDLEQMIIDKSRSYAAKRQVVPQVEHRSHKGA